ncbi:hypothetical protein BGZ60DRAFT_121443 [Tricladium varicosporioides]|nr:hypothetical protein BGZ60DRAFT_121443 [Hymenoscyphus varicosporioides]
MMETATELEGVLKELTSKEASRVSLPTMFSSDPQEPAKEHKVAEAISTTIDIIDRFSGVLNFIPVNNDYLHVITGVLKTISDATLNHRKIGEGFHDAIQKIGEEMKYCGGTLTKAQKSSKKDQQKVEIHVANVFIKVFAFLIPYTKWCTSRFTRFKSSFDKSFYEESVQGPLDDILKETRKLEREGNLQAQEGVLQVDQKVDRLSSQVEKLQMSLDENLRKRSGRLAIAEGEDDGMKKEKLLIQVGTMGVKFVEVMTQAELERMLLERERRERVQDAQRRQQLSNPWTTLLKPGNITKLAAIAAKEKMIQFIDVEVASRHLEVAANNGYPINLLATPEDMPTAPEIFKRLQEWMSGSDSSRLWMCGPAYETSPSAVSLAAASIVLVSEQNKMSMISYRIHLGDFEDSEMSEETRTSPSLVVDPDSSVEMERLIMMVYSLIRQMVWLLPENIDTESNLSFERFYLLDGSIKSLPEALNLFEDLLELMPSLLLVIIDGIQFVDNDRYDIEGLGSSGCFDSFLEILWNAELKKVLKVLLTSDGLCPTLLCEDNIGLDEVMEVLDSARQGHGQGQIPEFWEVLDDHNFSI